MFYREAGQFKTSYKADQAVFPIFQDRIFVAIWLFIGFVAVPMLANEYMFRAIFIPVIIMALAAIGLNLLVGVIFGIPSLRIKGFYLAVATLALQFFTDWTFSRIDWFTNYTPSGSIAVQPVEVWGFTFDSPLRKYMLCLSALVLFTIIGKNLVRGRIGRAWMATRDMDVAAEIIGIRPIYAKLSAFAVSSFFIGVAGALWAYVHLGSWEPLAFDINLSFSILFMVIIGGLGSIVGGMLGAAFITLLPLFLNQLPVWLGINISTAMVSHLEYMIFGALIIFFLAVEPLGLARIWQIIKEKLRLWPFPH